MARLVITPLAAALMLSTAVSARASDNDTATVKPQIQIATASAPVLEAWMQDQPTSSRALKVLRGSYAVMQGLDVYTTTTALRRGAREANPLMNTGMGQAMAFKAAMGISTYYAVNKLSKKNRKAAIVTMAILNGVTAAVVANNIKNSRR